MSSGHHHETMATARYGRFEVRWGIRTRRFESADEALAFEHQLRGKRPRLAKTEVWDHAENRALPTATVEFIPENGAG